jgi:hypothetical protein
MSNLKLEATFLLKLDHQIILGRQKTLRNMLNALAAITDGQTPEQIQQQTGLCLSECQDIKECGTLLGELTEI